MKKLGFTLAEVLISLGLIGVISALTIPTLVNNGQRDAYGATLATAVSNFETAMRTMIAAEDVAELTDTRAWRELPNRTISSNLTDNDIRQFMGNISDYIDIDSYDRVANFYSGRTVRGIDRNNVGLNNFAMANKVVFSTGKNVVYMINTGAINNGKIVTEAQALANGVNLREVAAFVLIDINGSQMPNMFGRDIFYFELGNDGVLYPFGGRDVSYMARDNLNSTWDVNSSFFACTDESKNNMGIGCTARLVENDYKMDY